MQSWYEKFNVTISAIVICFCSFTPANAKFDAKETIRLYFEAFDKCAELGYDQAKTSCKIHLIYSEELSNNGWCQSGAGKRPNWYQCEESMSLDSHTVSSIYELLKFYCEHYPGEHAIDACYINEEIEPWIMSNMCIKENSEGHDLTWVRCANE